MLLLSDKGGGDRERVKQQTSILSRISSTKNTGA